MSITISLSKSGFNTKYAPLAVLGYKYREDRVLEPLGTISASMKAVRYTPQMKLAQIVLSMLAGCEYISEVNTKLRPEEELSQVWGYPSIPDQSQLSLVVNELSQTNLFELRRSVGEIRGRYSHLLGHDWRGYLVLDLDLSGLPCSKRSEGSEKGYVSGKKTSQDGN